MSEEQQEASEAEQTPIDASKVLVIGPDGKISAVFRKVKPADHVAQLLEVL